MRKLKEFNEDVYSGCRLGSDFVLSLHQGDPAEVGVKRKRRRRQLVFFDPETQLSQEEQQERIGDPLVETRPPLLLSPPSRQTLPAAELFNNPCNSQ